VIGTVLAVLALVVGAAGCEPTRPLAIVYGDSLVWEAGAEIRQWAGARGYRVEIRQRFGGAPCSMFDEMRADRPRRPAKVILSFAGNDRYLEPCVGSDLAASYRAQMQEVKRIWTGSGTAVSWVAAPYHPSPGAEVAQDAMRAEAYRQGLGVADGGRYVTPGRVWSWTQPCMAGERCIGSQISSLVPPGRNIVRASDRVHFCPGPPKGFDPCPTYSSGAWRYARALTEPLSR
jgi:hypothetical protein